MGVYLDAVSTTCVNQEVKDSYCQLLDKYYCNSDALYDQGVAIYNMQEKARSNIAELLNVKKDDIVFTAGASEANSLAIKGLCTPYSNKKHVITTVYEHSSVYNCFRQLEKLGYEVTYLYPDRDGTISCDTLSKEIREDTLLVSIMMVNNEIGSVNNISSLAKIVKKHPGTYFHTDITQAIGKVDIDLKDVDLASFSAHKIHGLKGSGCLYRSSRVQLEPLICGGQQEYSIRGGTSNALVNIMLAKTLRIALQNKKQYEKRMQTYHDHLLRGLNGLATLNSSDNGLNCLLNISTPIKAEVLLNALNSKGIMVSSKSTCGSRKNESNRTLKAIGVDEDYAIRVSFDYTNTIEELDYFVLCLKEIEDHYGISI